MKKVEREQKIICVMRKLYKKCELAGGSTGADWSRERFQYYKKDV